MSADETKARAEAEGIAKRWVPDHMTARQGLVDDITASLINARQLERDQAEAWIRDAEGDGVAKDFADEYGGRPTSGAGRLRRAA